MSRPSRPSRQAFALVDVLCALAVCAFLALAAASAAALVRKSSDLALANLDAAIHLANLDAALAPDPDASPPALPRPWHLESEPALIPPPPEWAAALPPTDLPAPRPARRFLLRDSAHRLPPLPFTLALP